MTENQKEPPRVSALPLFVALVLAAFAEGGVAAYFTAAYHGSASAVALAFLAGLGLVFAAGLPMVVLAYLFVGGRTARDLARAAAEAIGGPDRGDPAMALVAILLSAGAAGAGAIWAGRIFLEQMTSRFAIVGVSIAALVLFAPALVAAISLSRVAVSLCNRLPFKRLSAQFEIAVAFWLAAVAVGLVAMLFLPWEWMPVPVALLAGLGLGLVSGIRRGLGRLFGARGRAVAGVAVGLALGLGMLGSYQWLPATAQRAILYRTPYAGNIANAALSLTGKGDGNTGASRGGTRFQRPAAPAYAIPEKWQRPYNIVLLFLDGLRPDHLQFAGYHRKTSPNLEAFQKTSVWFETAYTAAPVTRYAMAELLTGRDFRQLPMGQKRGGNFRLAPQVRTFPEALRDSEYDTAGFTIAYVVHHIQGMGQGFRIWTTPADADKWRQTSGKNATLATNAALDYLNTRQTTAKERKPFLLYVHYQSTHDPYERHREWDFGNRPVDRYDSALSYMDNQVKRVLDAIDARRDRDRTAVFIFSDHGELFGEHGLTNHSHSLYEPDVRIAMMVRLPGVAPRRVKTPVSLLDIMPTVRDLAQLPADPSADGWSLLTHLFATAPIPRRPLFLFTNVKRGRVQYEASGVLDWPHKYIADRRLKSVELYDVVSDPEESNDLALRKPALRDRLAALLSDYEWYVTR